MVVSDVRLGRSNHHCGPLRLPLSDVAVFAQSPFSTTGCATAIGEQPVKGLIDPAAMGRLTVGEACTNLVWAAITDIEDVKCSGNWMWASKLEGEGAAMYDCCEARGFLTENHFYSHHVVNPPTATRPFRESPVPSPARLLERFAPVTEQHQPCFTIQSSIFQKWQTVRWLKGIMGKMEGRRHFFRKRLLPIPNIFTSFFAGTARRAVFSSPPGAALYCCCCCLFVCCHNR